MFHVCNIGTLLNVSISVSTCAHFLLSARVEGCRCFGTDYTHLRQTHWGTYRVILVVHQGKVTDTLAIYADTSECLWTNKSDWTLETSHSVSLSSVRAIRR